RRRRWRSLLPGCCSSAGEDYLPGSCARRSWHGLSSLGGRGGGDPDSRCGGRLGVTWRSRPVEAEQRYTWAAKKGNGVTIRLKRLIPPSPLRCDAQHHVKVGGEDVVAVEIILASVALRPVRRVAPRSSPALHSFVTTLHLHGARNACVAEQTRWNFPSIRSSSR